MTNLEKLTKRIQELVPEIMELKFGCKVKMIIGKYTSCPKYQLGNYCGRYLGQNNCAIAGDDETMRYLSESEFEILGRDINLEDVLRATAGSGGEAGEIMIDTYGVIYMGVGIRGEHEETNATWQLGKPLHLQPTETIDFIYNLICNNE